MLTDSAIFAQVATLAADVDAAGQIAFGRGPNHFLNVAEHLGHGAEQQVDRVSHFQHVAGRAGRVDPLGQVTADEPTG